MQERTISYFFVCHLLNKAQAFGHHSNCTQKINMMKLRFARPPSILTNAEMGGGGGKCCKYSEETKRWGKRVCFLKKPQSFLGILGIIV